MTTTDEAAAELARLLGQPGGMRAILGVVTGPTTVRPENGRGATIPVSVAGTMPANGLQVPIVWMQSQNRWVAIGNAAGVGDLMLTWTSRTFSPLVYSIRYSVRRNGVWSPAATWATNVRHPVSVDQSSVEALPHTTLPAAIIEDFDFWYVRNLYQMSDGALVFIAYEPVNQTTVNHSTANLVVYVKHPTTGAWARTLILAAPGPDSVVYQARGGDVVWAATAVLAGGTNRFVAWIVRIAYTGNGTVTVLLRDFSGPSGGGFTPGVRFIAPLYYDSDNGLVHSLALPLLTGFPHITFGPQTVDGFDATTLADRTSTPLPVHANSFYADIVGAGGAEFIVSRGIGASDTDVQRIVATPTGYGPAIPETVPSGHSGFPYFNGHNVVIFDGSSWVLDRLGTDSYGAWQETPILSEPNTVDDAYLAFPGPGPAVNIVYSSANEKLWQDGAIVLP